jgi:hypothetical protein
MIINDAQLKILDGYIKQFQQIADRIDAQFTPIFEEAEKIEKFHNNLRKGIHANLEESLDRINSINSSISSQIDFSILESAAKQFEVFQLFIETSISAAFDQLQKSLDEFPPRLKKALLIFGENGWYLDFNMPMPDLWILAEALSDGNSEDAESVLVKYFENRLEEIELSIIERFPKRAHLIKLAFGAHKREEYGLSIPVFLAQTDGICNETINQHLFTKDKKKNRPNTAKYVDKFTEDALTEALLSPLSHILPISASVDERGADFNALNRHMVLHGESLDYGNKINSLKAISLLNYVAHVLPVKEDK